MNSDEESLEVECIVIFEVSVGCVADVDTSTRKGFIQRVYESPGVCGEHVPVELVETQDTRIKSPCTNVDIPIVEP